jgi:hypothetical protein
MREENEPVLEVIWKIPMHEPSWEGSKNEYSRILNLVGQLL